MKQACMMGARLIYFPFRSRIGCSVPQNYPELFDLQTDSNGAQQKDAREDELDVCELARDWAVLRSFQNH